MFSELTRGTVVAGFRVESLLGHGAMAEVYGARDESGRIVALKVLSDALGRDARFRQRFLRESQVAAGLDHPNIVSTLTSGEDDGRLYLILEYVDGVDLRQLLRNEGRLEPERAVALVEQVAAGLDAAHAAGLVHRDVKPGNVLIRDDHAYVCDFGLARHVSSVSSLTGDRGFVGTIDYVPPEQIEGGKVDARADVYSLGCVLFECLAGVRPFDRDSELSVVFAHLNEPPPKVTDVRPELPAAFDELFATALAKSPDERYSTCGELATAARAALRGEVVARRRSRRLLAAPVALVLAAGAIGGYLAMRGGSDGLPERVTITPTSIGGARLGDSNILIEQLWSSGVQKLSMQTPPDYSVLRSNGRHLSAYFIGTTDKAVEITTSSSGDRTAEGIGPCSTVGDLKRTYGSRLKASPNNTHDGVVYGWTLGKHLFFAMSSPVPNTVNAVAIYDNPLGWAGFNASNDGPCAAASITTPVKRPAHIPVVKAVALPTTLAARSFTPNVTVRVPKGWTVAADSANVYSVDSPAGASLRFVLGPRAVGADGRPLQSVSTTARGLTAGVRRRPGLAVTAPQTILLGSPVFTATAVDVRVSRTAPTARVSALVVPGGTIDANRGRPMRIYFVPVRIGSLAHTLAIVLEAPSQPAFAAALPATAAIVKNLKVAAAPAANLSALSGFCTVPFNGTCLGEVDAGTYSTSTMRPKLTYTVPVGWTNSGDSKGFFGLIPPGGDYTAVDTGQSDYVNAFTSITTGNGRCADGHGTARTPEEFIRWLHSQPGVAPFTARPVSIGGLSGVVVDLRMPAGFTTTCPWSQGRPGQQVLTGLPPSPDQLNHSLVPPPMVMRLYLLHYNGGTLGIEIDDVRGDARLADYTKVVESFRFAPG